MFGLSQMAGFMTLLIASTLFFALSSVFGHDDGGADAGDGVTHGDNGPSLLSLRNLLLFGIGFGAAGSVATHLGYSLMLASSAGAAFGVVVTFLGLMFYRAIGRQQATSNTNTQKLIGRKAVVTTQIPLGRLGQVSMRDELGGTVYLDARSGESTTIEQGELVYITDAAGSLVTTSRQQPI